MKTLEQLDNEVNAAQFALTDARNRRDRAFKKETLPGLRDALLGKCFKTRNSYGVGRPKKWWIYRVVIEVLDTRHVKAFEFQDDGYGKIDFTIDKWSTVENWTEISPRECEQAFNRLCSTIGARYATALGIGGKPKAVPAPRGTVAKRSAGKPGRKAATPTSPKKTR